MVTVWGEAETRIGVNDDVPNESFVVAQIVLGASIYKEVERVFVECCRVSMSDEEGAASAAATSTDDDSAASV